MPQDKRGLSFGLNAKVTSGGDKKVKRYCGGAFLSGFVCTDFCRREAPSYEKIATFKENANSKITKKPVGNAIIDGLFLCILPYFKNSPSRIDFF
jgi:hypothetical protein